MSPPSRPFAPRRSRFTAPTASRCAPTRAAIRAPPVVFLHGGGQTRHAWGGTAAALARDGRLSIALDLRGHGESDWATGDAPYRLERFAADLRAVIAQLGRPPALVGASLGGLTSLLAVGEARAPIATAAVLVDIAPRIEPEGAKRITSFMIGVPTATRASTRWPTRSPTTRSHRSRPRDLESLKKNLRSARTAAVLALGSALHGRRRPGRDRRPPASVRRRAPARVPTLLVRGRESDILSDDGVREFLAHLPNAQYVDVGGAGHMVAGDRNDAFTEAVREFLARAVARRLARGRVAQRAHRAAGARRCTPRCRCTPRSRAAAP
jgi:non-heme chloroperoxidase